MKNEEIIQEVIKYQTDTLEVLMNKAREDERKRMDIEGKKEYKKKIFEWHNLLVNGVVNGLSSNARDERLNDVDFWKRRSNLFDAFANCIQSLITEQDYHLDEKELKKISEEGYKL